MSKINHLEEFSKTLAYLSRRYERQQLFDDFLTLAICSYHRTNIQSRLQEKDEINEELYLKTINRYDKETIHTFPKLLGILQSHIYTHPFGDLLGEYFTKHITRGQNGQYFTPEPICELMAQLNASEIQSGKHVLDPACGSGRTLLKFAENNPNNFFYAADISQTCAKMTTLNFFLNGLRGEVAWMNTLSMDWYGGWQINAQDLGIVPIEKGYSQIWIAPSIQKEETKPKFPDPFEQLKLF